MKPFFTKVITKMKAINSMQLWSAVISCAICGSIYMTLSYVLSACISLLLELLDYHNVGLVGVAASLMGITIGMLIGVWVTRYLSKLKKEHYDTMVTQRNEAWDLVNKQEDCILKQQALIKKLESHIQHIQQSGYGEDWKGEDDGS